MDIQYLKLLLAHPDYLSFQAEQLLMKKVHLKWNYWVGQKYCKAMPRIVSLRMNSADASVPLICRQIGSFGIAQGKVHKKEGRAGLTTEKITGIIDDVAGIKAGLYLWGSDPFFYPGFSDILEHISMKNVFCQINTRGTLLEKYADILIRLGINDIIVSIDGPQQVYKNLNPKSEDFEAVVTGIKKICTLKQERKSKMPLLRGTMMITQENYHYLDDALTCVEEMGFESFTVNYTFFVTDSIGESYNRFFLDTFNCPTDSWERCMIDIGGIEVAALVRDIMRLKRKPKKIPINFFPALKSWQIIDFYKKSDYSAGIDRCMIPWFMINVLENGNVVPCVDFPDFIIGNLLHDALFPCWNNDDMVNFRSELIRYGRFPICSKCSGLYIL